jgi:hypothetical protein
VTIVAAANASSKWALAQIAAEAILCSPDRVRGSWVGSDRDGGICPIGKEGYHVLYLLVVNPNTAVGGILSAGGDHDGEKGQDVSDAQRPMCRMAEAVGQIARIVQKGSYGAGSHVRVADGDAAFGAGLGSVEDAFGGWIHSSRCGPSAPGGVGVDK